ncbi:MAG: DUF4410 domain-containing protein [Desulfatirhabdiaceae bacterium]
MHGSFPFKFAMAWVLFLSVAGCSRTNVLPTSQVVDTQLPRPEWVLITNFDVSSADIKENARFFSEIQRGSEDDDPLEDERQLGYEVADVLAGELMVKIAEMGLRPMRVTSSTPTTKDSIIITGRFVNIDEGNRRRRNVIGFGAGKSFLDCAVIVSASGDFGVREIMAFDIHIDSGNLPGFAVMGPARMAAGAGIRAVVTSNAAISGVKSYKSASTQLAVDLAEDIAAELENYFFQQGWIHQNPAE